MKYGISIQKNLVKVHKRMIIPGLSPTQVASDVQFGMSRPEWVKFVVSAGAHHELDLSDPVTPNEVAKKLGITQKTAQRVLMHLALTREDVKYKNSGRIHIFWKEKKEKS